MNEEEELDDSPFEDVERLRQVKVLLFNTHKQNTGGLKVEDLKNTFMEMVGYSNYTTFQ
jgi:hypothetical protein